jgi:hypothetical protein
MMATSFLERACALWKRGNVTLPELYALLTDARIDGEFWPRVEREWRTAGRMAR